MKKVVRIKIELEWFYYWFLTTRVAVTILALSGAMGLKETKKGTESIVDVSAVKWYSAKRDTTLRDTVQRFFPPRRHPQRRTKFSIRDYCPKTQPPSRLDDFFSDKFSFFFSEFEELFCWLFFIFLIQIRDKKICFCNGIWRRLI